MDFEVNRKKIKINLLWLYWSIIHASLQLLRKEMAHEKIVIVVCEEILSRLKIKNI